MNHTLHYYIRPMLGLFRHWHYIRHGLWMRVMLFELTRLSREFGTPFDRLTAMSEVEWQIHADKNG